MHDEPILAYVKRRLDGSIGEWPKIAQAARVPYGTIVNIAQGKSTNPTLKSVQPLLDYFRELDAMVERLKQGPESQRMVAGE